MTKELKTLKDLGNGLISKTRLKLEAVKWVKHFKKKGIWMDGSEWGKFFNITEEDLNGVA